MIGIQPAGTVIESLGSTSLIAGWRRFVSLDSNSTGTGPELKNAGMAVPVSQMGFWKPIGGEQTASGYEVAWKVSGADQYMIWNTDSNGNYVSTVAQGNGASIVSYETSFHQDLNGDGVIGVAGTVIESLGSTSLSKLGDDLYFDSNSTGCGPGTQKQQSDDSCQRVVFVVADRRGADRQRLVKWPGSKPAPIST